MKSTFVTAMMALGSAPIAGHAASFSGSQMVDLAITRGRSHPAVHRLAGLHSAIFFIDSTDQAVFAGQNPLATLCIDDAVTGGGEALGGRLDSIGVEPVPDSRDDGVVAVRPGLSAPASTQAERPRIGVAGTANPIRNSRQIGCDRFADFRNGRNRRGSAAVRAIP